MSGIYNQIPEYLIIRHIVLYVKTPANLATERSELSEANCIYCLILAAGDTIVLQIRLVLLFLF